MLQSGWGCVEDTSSPLFLKTHTLLIHIYWLIYSEIIKKFKYMKNAGKVFMICAEISAVIAALIALFYLASVKEIDSAQAAIVAMLFIVAIFLQSVQQNIPWKK